MRPLLEQVFKTSGIPTYTFVEPKEYSDLTLNLRSPGRGLVVEGPSGIGKTTAIETALQRLGMVNVTKLSARRPKDVEYIEALPELGKVGVVIVDDFHKLSASTRSALADYMKTLADEESQDAKVIVVGINKAGENLVSFAHDLVNRLDVVIFESNPDEKGCAARGARLGSSQCKSDGVRCYRRRGTGQLLHRPNARPRCVQARRNTGTHREPRGRQC